MISRTTAYRVVSTTETHLQLERLCSPPAVKGKPSRVGPVGDAGSGVCTITPDQAVFDSALLAAQHVLELRRLRVRLPVSSWNQLGFSADLSFSESHVRSLANAALGVAGNR